MVSYTVFIILSLFVLICAVISFARSSISINSVVSLLASHFVMLGFLVYTFIFFIGYQVIPYVEDTKSENSKEFIVNLLDSKTLFEQLTYFATLAGLYSLLATNNMKFRKTSYRKRVKEKKFNSKLDYKYELLKEDIRLKEKLLKHYEQQKSEVKGG